METKRKRKQFRKRRHSSSDDEDSDNPDVSAMKYVRNNINVIHGSIN